MNRLQQNSCQTQRCVRPNGLGIDVVEQPLWSSRRGSRCGAVAVLSDTHPQHHEGAIQGTLV